MKKKLKDLMKKQPKTKGGCPHCGGREVTIGVVERFTVTTEFKDDGKLIMPDCSKGGDNEYEAVTCTSCHKVIENWELEDS